MSRDRPPRAPRRAHFILIVASAAVPFALFWGSSAFGSTASTPSPAASPSWTVYHGDPSGSGIATAVGSVDVGSPAWTSPDLDGTLYGEPLVSGGEVFVATENDTVYALSGTNGAIDWSSHLATPVPSSSLPCGDIAPTVGITGTPVLDEARGEVFVVADEMVNGRPAHQLVGLSAATGKVELSQNVDPEGSTPAALLQRTGLTLDAGRIIFGYGGNFGDCSTYHGWVMSVPEAGGTPAAYAIDSAAGETQGAVWMGGAAPVVDASGNIWVTSGNGSVTSASHAFDDSDAVLQLSPSLALEQYFAPTSWASDNARDLDFSTGVALLADGQAIAASKSRTVFLLNQQSLGGVGGQQAELADACSTVIDGGLAVAGSIVYLPCLSGPIAVQVSDSPAGLRLLWSSSVGGGPPIVAGGLVWTIGSNGVLYGLNPASGKVTEQATIGAPANHFPTPSIGAGLLLAPSSKRVVAFSAPTSAAPASASTTTTTFPRATTTSSAPTGQTAGTSAWIIAAAVVGGLGILAVAAWFLRRQRNVGGDA